MGILTGAWVAVGCRLSGKPTSAWATLMKSLSGSFLQALQLGLADQSLLSSTILMARVVFGGGVGGFASHGTLRSFLGLVNFLYFLGLVCLFPCLMCLPSRSKWKCFNAEKITTDKETWDSPVLKKSLERRSETHCGVGR